MRRPFLTALLGAVLASVIAIPQPQSETPQLPHSFSGAGRALIRTLGSALQSTGSTPAPFAAGATWSVCTTPGQNCEQAVVDFINQQKQEIRFLDYQLTSKPITEAYIAAKKRGVDIQGIVDQEMETVADSRVRDLLAAKIPIGVDLLGKPRGGALPPIAHNKVIIGDRANTKTGSFNNTRKAQDSNGENVLIVRQEPAMAAVYLDYWNKRAAGAVAFDHRPQAKSH